MTLKKPAFSPFPIVFSALSKRKIVILATFNLSSANAFNLVMSKNLSFGKGFRSYPWRHDPEFKWFWRRRFLITLVAKEKMLITSIFSFSPNFLWAFKKDLFFTLSQTSTWFLLVCSASLLKTQWEKEKLLVTSNFSFSQIVFYPFEELSAIFIKSEIVVCIIFQFGRVWHLLFWKELNEFIWATFNLLSENYVKTVESKTFSLLNT